MSVQPVKLKLRYGDIGQNQVSLNIVNPSSKHANRVNIKPSTGQIKLNIQSPNNTGQKINIVKPSPVGNTKNKKSGDGYRVSADDYQRYDTTREHIYNITDTYVGSDEKMERHERVLNLDTMTFQEEEIDLPEAIERVFIEISSNAGDNVARSLRHGIDPGEVTIRMDKHMIMVRNGGIPIPIEVNQKEKMWAPQLIFGMLHSSSNYDKKKIRTECGRNGYGAKLTNIFSKQFMVTIGDPHNKKWYRQVWNENMTIRSEPEIKTYEGEAFVEIVYKLDFERFGYDCYPDNAFRLFARHAADMSFTGKVPVSFNGKKLNVQGSLEYAKLHLGKDAVSNSIVFYQWARGVETVNKKGILYAKNKGVVPVVEICAVDTPDNAINVSFVNGMWTRNGGVHADAAFKAVASGILNTVNGGKEGQKRSRTLKLNLGDVKRHVSMFISCWLGDPKFDSQAKRALRKPTPKIVIDEKILQPITKWDLINRLYAELEAKHYKAISKSDGKKRAYLSDIKGEDANQAGKGQSLKCTLYVVEGKSAMGFAVKMLSLYDKGRDYIGLLPLKGKPLNVMNADPMQIVENSEIADIKKMLGLRERVNYLDEENFKTLRYGHFMILADSDNDGKHILGLILNLFHCRYPSLLARGYVKYLRTKIIDVKKGRQKLKFYTNHQYEEWKAKTPDYRTWEHAYFKGLASSNDTDIEEEFQAPRVVQCFYDDLSPNAFNLAFHCKMSDERKEWIRTWQPDYRVEELQMQPISSFINHEFIQFSIADVARSIPRFLDGLKLSQRKILWGSMKKWKGSKKATKTKVGILAPYVSSETGYQHGETCLADTIVKMTQTFTGSNNMAFYKPEGQFGTRNFLGKDSGQSRYIYVCPGWWWKYIFKKEDRPLLKMVIDEGMECEPVTFLPILPIQLINGTTGIGTGHSTFIPNHDPIDICTWLTAKIKGYPLPAVLPWYRGFTGTITIKERNVKKKKTTTQTPTGTPTPGDTSDDTDNESDNDISDDDNNNNNNDDLVDNVAINSHTKYTLVTSGTFELVGNRRKKIVVNELPIGRSMHDYDKWLKRQKEEKVISGFNNYSGADKVLFEITGMKNPTTKKLRLEKSFGMSNMVLLDMNDRPVKYNSTTDILETFYAMRLPYYQLRKENIIKSMEDKINYLNTKIRFIIAVIDGYNLVKTNPNITIEEAVNKGCILSMGLSKKDITPQMEKLGFPAELLKRVTLYQCTKEEMQAARNELDVLNTEKVGMENTAPESMWQADLDAFMGAYCKEYKCSPVKKHNVMLNVCEPVTNTDTDNA
jgi:DNA topoisomerase-2